MCGDRGNSICDGVQTDEAGAYMTGPTAPYQRKMTTFGVCAGYGERHFNILPPDFDGGMRPVGLNITPWFQIPGYSLAPPGSYGCVFPSLWGSAGLIALDEGYLMNLYTKAPGVHLGVQLAGMPRQMKAGERLHYRYVLMHGRTGESPNTAEWERFVRTMGFRGPPGYEVKDTKAGRVKSQRFLLELEPTEGAFVGTVSAADLPIRLPVRVAQMNPNWTFGWFDLDRKEWHPSAVDREIRQGFFTLDTRRGNHRLFAGHPVLADNPEARIAVFSDGKSEVCAAVNNVGDAPMPLTIRLNPALGTGSEHLLLAPGELKNVTFKLTAK